MTGAPDTALEAALALRYEHAFDIRINFDKRWVFGPISGGARHGYTSVGSGCTVRGPLLNGKLVDFSGADWPVVRPDGLTVSPGYLCEVKKPEESKHPWDYYRVLATIPVEDAWRPLSAGGCSLAG